MSKTPKSTDSDLIVEQAALVAKLWAGTISQTEAERTFYRLRSELAGAKRVLKSKVNGKWLPIKEARNG